MVGQNPNPHICNLAYPRIPSSPNLRILESSILRFPESQNSEFTNSKIPEPPKPRTSESPNPGIQKSKNLRESWNSNLLFAVTICSVLSLFRLLQYNSRVVLQLQQIACSFIHGSFQMDPAVPIKCFEILPRSLHIAFTKSGTHKTAPTILSSSSCSLDPSTPPLVIADPSTPPKACPQ